MHLTLKVSPVTGEVKLYWSGNATDRSNVHSIIELNGPESPPISDTLYC